MPPPSTDALGHPAALALVRRKARLLKGQAGLTAQDLEDVEQDLLLAILPRLKRHNPAKSPLEAFIRLLLDHEADRLIRHRLAAKRRRGRAADVNSVDPDRDARMGREPGRAELDRDLSLDLEAAIAMLPAKLRDLVEAFRTEPTVAGAARDLGRKRTTVHDQLARVRDRLRQAGLLELAKLPRHSAAGPGTSSDSGARARRRPKRRT